MEQAISSSLLGAFLSTALALVVVESQAVAHPGSTGATLDAMVPPGVPAFRPGPIQLEPSWDVWQPIRYPENGLPAGTSSPFVSLTNGSFVLENRLDRGRRTDEYRLRAMNSSLSGAAISSSFMCPGPFRIVEVDDCSWVVGVNMSSPYLYLTKVWPATTAQVSTQSLPGIDQVDFLIETVWAEPVGPGHLGIVLSQADAELDSCYFLLDLSSNTLTKQMRLPYHIPKDSVIDKISETELSLHNAHGQLTFALQDGQDHVSISSISPAPLRLEQYISDLQIVSGGDWLCTQPPLRLGVVLAGGEAGHSSCLPGMLDPGVYALAGTLSLQYLAPQQQLAIDACLKTFCTSGLDYHLARGSLLSSQLVPGVSELDPLIYWGSPDSSGRLTWVGKVNLQNWGPIQKGTHFFVMPGQPDGSFVVAAYRDADDATRMFLPVDVKWMLVRP